MNPYLDGCEVQDFVLNPDGTVLQYREQNAAANAELARRYPDTLADRWGGLSRSGDAAPYGILWRSTCGEPDVIEPGSGDVVEAYGLALYGLLRYGGPP